MNAPQEFQGTSGDVTVPLSAARRDRFVRSRPRRANSARNTRVGSTRAMYWSPATMLSPMATANTDRNSRPVVRVPAMTGSTRRPMSPNSSSSAPNVTAPMISQSVGSIDAMPPRDRRRSMSPMPDSIENPVAMACHPACTDPSTPPRPSSSPAVKSCTTSGWSTPASTAANSADVMRASDAGTFLIDSPARSTSGSRLSGVIR